VRASEVGLELCLVTSSVDKSALLLEEEQGVDLDQSLATAREKPLGVALEASLERDLERNSEYQRAMETGLGLESKLGWGLVKC
jgi:hypothetical protein